MCDIQEFAISLEYSSCGRSLEELAVLVGEPGDGSSFDRTQSYSRHAYWQGKSVWRKTWSCSRQAELMKLVDGIVDKYGARDTREVVAALNLSIFYRGAYASVLLEKGCLHRLTTTDWSLCVAAFPCDDGVNGTGGRE